MALTVQDLIRTARMTQLDDPDGTTWPDSAMLHGLNEALRMLALLRPDATSVIHTLVVVAGTRQFIPSDGERLLKVVRNINSDDSIGRAIRLVNQNDMDSMSPDWHQQVGTRVSEYCFDDRTPKWFYIYPSVAAGSKIEIEYSKTPPALGLEDLDDDIPVSVIFSQPLQELMLYKLLSGDSSRGQASTNHLNTAVQMLGLKTAADVFSSPTQRDGAR